MSPTQVLGVTLVFAVSNSLVFVHAEDVPAKPISKLKTGDEIWSMENGDGSSATLAQTFKFEKDGERPISAIHFPQLTNHGEAPVKVVVEIRRFVENTPSKDSLFKGTFIVEKALPSVKPKITVSGNETYVCIVNLEAADKGKSKDVHLLRNKTGGSPDAKCFSLKSDGTWISDDRGLFLGVSSQAPRR